MSVAANTLSGTGEESTTKVHDWQLFSRLLGMLSPYSGGIALALLSALAGLCAQILNPLILSLVIDVYFLHHKPDLDVGRLLPANAWTGLRLLSAAYLAILAFSLVCETVQATLVQWIGQRAMADLRRTVLTHLQRLHIRFYDVTPVGRVVTRATSDIEALSDLFSNGIVSILANIIMTLFFLGVMFRLNWRLTLVLAAVLPAFIALTLFFRRIITDSQQKGRILIARINAFIAEHISGISVVQAFCREETSLARFDEINRQNMVVSKQWVTANAWFLPSIEFCGAVSQAGLLLAGGYLLHGGTVTVGAVVAFLQYGTRFLRPIQEISERYGVMQTSLVSAQKVFDVLDTPPSAVPSGELLPPPEPALIHFEDISFAYRSANWVLHDLNLTIKPGQMLAIVGHTGAGKTTITNLLLRFYEPQRGRIYLGDHDLSEIDIAALRSQFGVVPQDAYIWEGTILDNIRFGSDIPDEAVRAAAGEVGLDTALAHLPQGLMSRVEERGESLSSGQKQLIAFARALVQNPLYLILDEATSNIDVQTEAQIRQAMRTALRGRTSIVIAHRLSTILTADRILVMHKGRAAEIGSHDELLAMRGLYWRLFQLQFGQAAATAL